MPNEVSPRGRVAAALKATSLNIILHVSMRVCTFVLNAFILRHISKYAFGVINVRLMLLFSTIHLLASEPFRRACCTDTSGHKWNKIINLSWLSIPSAIVLGAPLSLIWVKLLEAPDDPTYSLAVGVTYLAALMEVAAEPMFIVGCAFGYVKFKVFAEGSALVLRCILMSVLVIVIPDYALLAYAISQLISSVYFTVTFYLYFHIVCAQKLDQNLPITQICEMIPSLDGIDRVVGGLVASFMKQTAFKQVLTEGERYVMTAFCVLDFASQGVYEAVNNLGSLAARYIFRQVEENGYLLFGQLLCRDDSHGRKELSMRLSADVLSNLLKLMLIVALMIVSFGQAFSGTLLFLYAGNSLLPLGCTLMRLHCLYIAFIAINGITECFMFATMSKQQLDDHNTKMALCSVLFIFALYVFSRLFGAVGLILANMVNMSMRILLSFYYISNFYAQVNVNIVSHSLPSMWVFAILIASCALTLLSEALIGHRKIAHIGFGAICFLITTGAIYLCEHELATFIKKSLMEKQL
ncbi:protein RFT1-like [Tropilaelaps mercedesae]|uniref:Protein RFT1 homolog n=1 Tax=Tropilaelaps mercedesae TaxID=418985 RepID=A0A1V9XJI0_9ACAR|nr:protein RFT1-like [Tropilaelaps mercedesae]